MRAADPAVGERSPRLHGDFPEQNFAELVEELLDVIGLTDGDAAGRDHHVGGRGGGNERALELLRHVLDHAHVDHVAIEPRQHAVQRVAIAVVDLAGAKRRADGLELVAGGEEGDAQPAIHAHLAHAERRDRAELGRAHSLSCREHRLPRAQVLAGEAPILARLAHRARGDSDLVVGFGRALLHHDGIGAGRHDAAGENAHAFARRDRARPRLARERLADPVEHGVGIRLQVGKAQRVAVHRRIVVARHRDRRHHVLRQHAAERAADMNTLDRGHRCEKAADQLARLRHRHRIRIVVVGAGSLAQGGRCAHGLVGDFDGQRKGRF